MQDPAERPGTMAMAVLMVVFMVIAWLVRMAPAVGRSEQLRQRIEAIRARFEELQAHARSRPPESRQLSEEYVDMSLAAAAQAIALA